MKTDPARIPEVRRAACVLMFLLSSSFGGPPAQALQVEVPRLPTSEEAVAKAVSAVLVDYYRRWRALPPEVLRSGPVCDADLGQDCLGRDVDGGCNARRCRSDEEVAAFREELKGLVERYPHSPLPLSHAVYAAVKLGDLEMATDLIEGCAPGGEWWCDLATAYVLHRTGRSTVADPYFQRALSGMPPSLRCGLENVLALLPRDVRSEYEGLPCEARAEAHQWFWWATDPFLANEGNDRWAEHLARGFEGMVNEDLLARVDETNFFRPRGYRSHYMRRGIHDSFDRNYESPEAWTSRKAAFNHFVPEVLSLTGLHDDLHYRLAAETERASDPGDEGYTRTAGRVVQVPVQIARFREGDSLDVALASDLESAGFGGPNGQGFFVASEGPEHVVALDPAPLREVVAFQARLANRKQLVGIEVFTPGPDARHREVLQPLDSTDLLLSDLLLFRPMGPTLPDTRIGAVALMYGSQRVSRDWELGLYWEVYGFSAEEELDVSLRLENVEGGWLSQALQVVGIGGEGRSTVSWAEKVERPGPSRSAVTLNLGSVDPGWYDLVIEVTAGGEARFSRKRRFEVIDTPWPGPL